MNIEFHPKAEQEFIEAAAYLESRVPGLGQRFVSELERNKEILLEWPELGAQIDETFRHFVFRRFPYSLIYVLEPTVIWVVAVAHDRRLPDYWRNRDRV